MARGKRYQPEQVVNLLRQIEVAVANGKTTAQACKEAEIVEQTYFRWRKEYGGLQIDQAKRLKELEQENAKLKRLVANLTRRCSDSRSGDCGPRPSWTKAPSGRPSRRIRRRGRFYTAFDPLASGSLSSRRLQR